MQLVICSNTNENFLREPEKTNVKFHNNCENTGKISCARCNFVKFDIHFLGIKLLNKIKCFQTQASWTNAHVNRKTQGLKILVVRSMHSIYSFSNANQRL